MKVEYYIGLYDENNNIIKPSEISLYNNLSIICTIVLEIDNNINSLANIYKDKYYYCIEFCKINETIKFGITIYGTRKNCCFILFSDKIFIYDSLINQINENFEPLLIIEKYNSLIKKDEKKYQNLKLKKTYLEYPNFILKRNTLLFGKKWLFKSIYNHYFCFCKGPNCIIQNIDEGCKYVFYLYIIDNNREIYRKTDYLFIDFIFADLSSDDVYPIFKKMYKQNLPVHYLTEKIDIYNEYCKHTQDCLIILHVKKEKNPINSQFLEKYLNLFLKLKVVVSGRGTTFNTNLFYNIEYITYVCVGHGVCYFKYYLYNYNRIYGIGKNDKILLPPSDKIINIAKKYGWKEEDIIKFNLPRWDKYNSNEGVFSNLDDHSIKIQTNSIFIMFTWRNIKRNKEISSFYFKNIIYILTNGLLNEIIIKKNITLYISFHRLIDEKYINKFKKKKILDKNIQFINQSEISECLSKTSLVVTDFSSIIFDLMYRRKPFIIYIPDANDPQIEYIYKKEYYELIQLMKNNTIYFENKFFDVNQTINKIIYYINNNYNLDLKLQKFYDSFGFRKGNNLNKFIDYLKYLK